MSDSEIPNDLRYTAEHEWARLADGADGRPVVRVGITAYAQSSLGDIVFVQLPDVGTTVTEGEAVGEVESTKSVSDLYAPITGEVTARNDAVEASPELANSDPYGAGWLLEISIADAAAYDALLDAQAYGGLTAT
ncbi:MAG: glycine cleavage system protein GcvH [Actinomycetota bacterium]|nr:glycine cleavage system protein GcvH [Actinomycetota bacterium]